MRVDLAGDVVDDKKKTAARISMEQQSTDFEKEDDSAAAQPVVPQRSGSTGPVDGVDGNEKASAIEGHKGKDIIETKSDERVKEESIMKSSSDTHSSDRAAKRKAQQGSGRDCDTTSNQSKTSTVGPLSTSRNPVAFVRGISAEKARVSNPTHNYNSLMSVKTSNPPQPPNDLTRNEYLPTTPGAIRVTGLVTKDGGLNDDATIAIGGDTGHNPTTSSTDAEGKTLINAELVGEEDEEGGTGAVSAEPMQEENPKTFLQSLKDRRIMSMLLILVLAVATLATGLVLGLGKSEQSSTKLIVATIAPTPVIITPAPSSSPTRYIEFDPPSPEDCLKIANGEAVDGQEDRILRNFQVELDVVVESTNDIDSLLLGELTRQLQSVFATSLAGCDDVSRYLEKNHIRRRLQRKYVVANALVDADVAEGQSCRSGALGNCHRVVATLELYLKGAERIQKLLGLIIYAFDQDSLTTALGLGTHFISISLISIISTDPTEAPTEAPTAIPTRRPTFRPTVVIDDTATDDGEIGDDGNFGDDDFEPTDDDGHTNDGFDDGDVGDHDNDDGNDDEVVVDDDDANAGDDDDDNEIFVHDDDANVGDDDDDNEIVVDDDDAIAGDDDDDNEIVVDDDDANAGDDHDDDGNDDEIFFDDDDANVGDDDDGGEMVVDGDDANAVDDDDDDAGNVGDNGNDDGSFVDDYVDDF
jgi:hypothetical protein